MLTKVVCGRILVIYETYDNRDYWEQKVMDTKGVDLIILKNRLTGSNLINLLKRKKLTKWKIAKDCGLTYRTILNWAQEKTKPTIDNAIIVGRYLNLIEVDEVERQREIKELKERIDRLI